MSSCDKNVPRSRAEMSCGQRNAFRRYNNGRDLVRDLEDMDMDELRRQQFAMRSFTESVEMDGPPPAFVDENLASNFSGTGMNSTNTMQYFGGFYDAERRCSEESGTVDSTGNVDGGMRTSSTVDTIIELIKPELAARRINETLGETQKYVMTVPGPGHVDQEIELHKSLIRHHHEDEASPEIAVSASTSTTPVIHDTTAVNGGGDETEDEMLDLELRRIQALAEAAEKALRNESNTIQQSSSPPLLSSAAIREEYQRVAAQMARPRPTTPTTSMSPLDRLSSLDEYRTRSGNANGGGQDHQTVPVKDRLPPDASKRIRVTIPTSTGRRRCSSMSQSSVEYSDGRRHTLQNDNADLLEANPEYAKFAPPKPVVHRRTSVDWENFESDGNAVSRKFEDDNRRDYSDAFSAYDSKISNDRQTKQDDLHSAVDSVFGRKMEPVKNGQQQCSDLSNQRSTADSKNSLVPAEFAESGFTNSDMKEITTSFDRHHHEDSLEEHSIEALTSQPISLSDTTAVAPSTSIVPVRTAPPPPHAVSDTAESEVPAGLSDAQDALFDSQQQQPLAMELPTQPEDLYSSSAGYDAYSQPIASSSGDYGMYYGQGGYDAYGIAQPPSDTGYGNYGGEAQQNYYGSSAYGYDANATYGASATTAASCDSSNAYPYDGYDYGVTETADCNNYGACLDTATYGTDNSNIVPDNNGAKNEVDPTAGASSYYGSSNYPAISYDTTGVNNENSSGSYVYDDGGDDYSKYGSLAQQPAVSEPPLTNDDFAQQYAVDGASSINAFDSASDVGLTGLVSGPPQFMQPILPLQRARTPDPFSWEAQETAYAEHGTAVAPPHPPPITPSPVPPSEAESVEEAQVESQHQPTEELAKHELYVEPGSSPKPPRPSPPPPRPKAPPERPPAPSPAQHRREVKPEKEEEEDPWARFKQMSEQVSSAVRSTTEQLKTLSEQSAANEIRDESYLAQVGGSQSFQLNAGQRQILQLQEEAKKAKAEKKRQKASKKPPSPTFDPNREEDIEKQAAELVKKMAATRMDLADWKPPISSEDSDFKVRTTEPSLSLADNKGDETKADVGQESKAAEDAEDSATASQFADFSSEAALAAASLSAEPEVPRTGWAAFQDDGAAAAAFAQLPTSDSDFFAKTSTQIGTGTEDELAAHPNDPIASSTPPASKDPFAPIPDAPSLISDVNYDPFDTRPAEEIFAEARQQAERERLKQEQLTATHSGRSSATPEGGSPMSARPVGFDDDFHVQRGGEDETPLFDEDDSQPLDAFPAPFTGDGWELMLRYPLKKKIMADRFWKPCYVRIQGNMLMFFNEKMDSKPYQEILLQASYSLSDTTLQAYDVLGKIHTFKLQHVLYKERVGIRPGQISRLVEGHVTKYGLPLEHAAQCTVLAKFGSLNEDTINSFVNVIEDLLFKCVAKRDTTPLYKQDEVQIHCYDEYSARVDKDGVVSEQRARVRLFCLAFLSGSPLVEIGLNDRRRQGKEIVRRKDILPMYTERWIRFEALEFHNTVERVAFDEDQVVRFQPPDGCFFEVMRFRVRPPKNREKPLTVKCFMRIAGSKVQIDIKAMAAAQQQRERGDLESTRSIPCEDIQIRFPIPEPWIYIFREERHWGVGSVHSKTRRTGKVKNLKDRLMGTVQHTEQTLIEVAIGEAKYEHVHRALVWRIPRLPEKHHNAYKTHSLKCQFELSSFDQMPDTFIPDCRVEFTMPLATISNTVVRSVGVEQHEDSDRVEKFVRYVAKCRYKVDVDYALHCASLSDDICNDEGSTLEVEPRQHVAAFDPSAIDSQHEGYGIDLPKSSNGCGIGEEDGGFGATQRQQDAYGFPLEEGDGERKAKKDSDSSSSDDEAEKKRRVPMIEINMQGYGY